MREAVHVVENALFRLPNPARKDEIENLKKLAEKGLFQCPYCKARVIIKSGEVVPPHFSHLYSEACEESKVMERAEKRYSKQVERETVKHLVMVSIIYNELLTQSRNRDDVEVEYGYKVKHNLTEFPDIWVKVGKKEFAISVVTNVNFSKDDGLAKRIKKRHQIFIGDEMTPIWFIENKELSIEKDKNAIVLWDAEAVIAIKSEEDKKWDAMLNTVIEDKSFFRPFNYVPSMNNISVDVRSMYYISSLEDRIVVHIQRFMTDCVEKPLRSFLLNDGYEIPFADALIINQEFALCNPEQEEKNRKHFLERYQLLVKELEEKEACESEMEKKRIEGLRKEKEELLERRREEYLLNGKKRMTYPELTSLLRKKINLTRSQQMELWTKFMPKVGYINVEKIWSIVEEHNVQTFTELKEHLQAMILKKS
ncbi:competence protein CoiA family protein [Bacillus cereus]|uniref:competence protein CoiA family protein n=1 Tax=Bacillus cereus TaxID=1396 RepID=UPI00027ABA0C|nr:hypothetical protein [Bacillus cereus]EJS68621.1 hypothetical protein ICY_04695 [Bacillus cereus BAG2X1-3]